MKTIKASELKPNDCAAFEYKGTRTIRFVRAVKHDEGFATPSGGGDLYHVSFEPREGLPDSAEYPPHVDVEILDEHELGEIFGAACEVIGKFAEATMTPGTAHVPQALHLLDAQDLHALRTRIRDAKSSPTS